MRMVVALKLLPSPEQADSLRQTLETANAAANTISAVAWRECTFGKYALQKRVYGQVRAESGLTAQVVVRVIAKVAHAYKRDRERRRAFAPLGALAYDDRILRYGRDGVSIWTTAGRQYIPFVCGEHQRRLLAQRQGESDLVYRGGRWFLFATVCVVEPAEFEPTDVLGVDLGIKNVAADSDGTTYAGGHLNGLRRRHERLRRRLQRKGTKAAGRLLGKRARKERRFATCENHRISKQLVRTAECTQRAIALEDLEGIRSRIKARRPQRRTLHGWAFHQLRQFVLYKAALAGVPVALVDPRNTSRACPACGRVDAGNRPTRDRFCCVSCGLAGPADTIAALNIRGRGRVAVNRPYAGQWGHRVETVPATSSAL
jgi:putative transposase